MATFDYLLRHTCCRPYANHVTVVAVKRFSHCVPTFVSIAWTSLMPTLYVESGQTTYYTYIYIYIYISFLHPYMKSIGVTHETIFVTLIAFVSQDSKWRSGRTNGPHHRWILEPIFQVGVGVTYLHAGVVR